MLSVNLITKSRPVMLTHTFKRFKIRILPKESYSEYETPFMDMRPKPRKSQMVDVLGILHRKNWKFADIKHFLKWKDVRKIKEDQKYFPERLETLGPDLAATHFITFRCGKVKFKGWEEWVTCDHIEKNVVPSTYDKSFTVEKIDASGSTLCYEGFDNMRYLRGITSLNLSKCTLIDDWCLNRLYMFRNSLEHLDLSGCLGVTERGLSTLYILKKLKTLVIRDTPNVKNKELVSLLLLDFIPHLDIVGVDFDDPVLIERTRPYME